MSLYFDSFLSEALVALIILFVTVYFYFQNAYKYWESRGIPTAPFSFPFGHMGPVLLRTENIGHRLQVAYNQFKSTSKYIGWYSFNKPALIVTDPEEIKNIFVRDFNNFHDRGVYFNEKDDPLSAHLFSIEGQKWKNLRNKLSPTFTSGKMKYMFPTMLERADHLNFYLRDAITKDSTIEMKDVLARFSTDVIGTCAFGIECNSLTDPDAEFRRYGQKIFDRNFIQSLKLSVSTAYKGLSKKLGVANTHPEVAKFFMKVVKDTVKHREENNIRRKDFMDMLIQLKNTGRLEDDVSVKNGSISSPITLHEAAAQAFVFFVAGFETSSTVMSFALYELAVNPDIQEKLRQEIESVLEKHEGNMTYDAIMDMRYLDRVIDETLRKYPTLPLLFRNCSKDYKIPDTDMIIRKGMRVLIPVRGLHHDPQYYPDPEKFDPDRFTAENKAKRHHYTYLPFGEGPRNCIGMRFGQMQTRLGLVSVVRNFILENSNKTPVPLILDPKIALTASLGGMWLNLKEVTQ